ncbi:hypothetical protein L2E82_08186 [Cichorium intybus]|uniref:Uncharacterized protein n=1 Tax=Cichorium intybus TaxID=13427 RepID=A0ACB9G6T2_CICIN|nr:hypothetical protein L2E82_08186 [Cichorium intybus]
MSEVTEVKPLISQSSSSNLPDFKKSVKLKYETIVAVPQKLPPRLGSRKGLHRDNSSGSPTGKRLRRLEVGIVGVYGARQSRSCTSWPLPSIHLIVISVAALSPPGTVDEPGTGSEGQSSGVRGTRDKTRIYRLVRVSGHFCPQDPENKTRSSFRTPDGGNRQSLNPSRQKPFMYLQVQSYYVPSIIIVYVNGEKKFPFLPLSSSV